MGTFDVIIIIKTNDKNKTNAKRKDNIFILLLQVKLAQHCYSQLCGTFLGNCEQERERELVSLQTVSLWDCIMKEKETRNILYKDNGEEVSICT